MSRWVSGYGRQCTHIIQDDQRTIDSPDGIISYPWMDRRHPRVLDLVGHCEGLSPLKSWEEFFRWHCEDRQGKTPRRDWLKATL